VEPSRPNSGTRKEFGGARFLGALWANVLRIVIPRCRASLHKLRKGTVLLCLNSNSAAQSISIATWSGGCPKTIRTWRAARQPSREAAAWHAVAAKNLNGADARSTGSGSRANSRENSALLHRVTQLGSPSGRATARRATAAASVEGSPTPAVVPGYQCAPMKRLRGILGRQAGRFLTAFSRNFVEEVSGLQEFQSVFLQLSNEQPPADLDRPIPCGIPTKQVQLRQISDLMFFNLRPVNRLSTLIYRQSVL